MSQSEGPQLVLKAYGHTRLTLLANNQSDSQGGSRLLNTSHPHDLLYLMKQ